MINLVPTAEQQQVIDSVTDFLKNKLPVERLRDRKIAPGAAARSLAVKCVYAPTDGRGRRRRRRRRCCFCCR